MEKLVSGALTALLRRLGWPSDFTCEPLRGGANNQVYCVESGGKRVVMKHYFQHPQDQRNRMGAEFQFGSLAWTGGVRAVAQPLLSDAAANIALYEFVAGDPILPGNVTAEMVRQAGDFFVAVNQLRDSDASRRLPLASEAYFSVAEHVTGVGHRMKALSAIDVVSDADRQAQRFVEDELLMSWQRVQAEISGFVSDVVLLDRCLSPSDFGFHNALRKSDGSLVFVDFEYAGWDDPAKTICDFFCQPKVPVALEYFDEFATRIASVATNPASVRLRAERLMSLYKVKWSCILLNEFLPVDQKRRHFSGVAGDREGHKLEQLNKAKRALSALAQGGRRQ